MLVCSARLVRTIPPHALPIPRTWTEPGPLGTGVCQDRLDSRCPGADITSRTAISLSLSSEAQGAERELLGAEWGWRRRNKRIRDSFGRAGRWSGLWMDVGGMSQNFSQICRIIYLFYTTLRITLHKFFLVFALTNVNDSVNRQYPSSRIITVIIPHTKMRPNPFSEIITT